MLILRKGVPDKPQCIRLSFDFNVVEISNLGNAVTHFDINIPNQPEAESYMRLYNQLFAQLAKLEFMPGDTYQCETSGEGWKISRTRTLTEVVRP